MLHLLGRFFGGHSKLVEILRNLGIALLLAALGAGATAIATSNPALAVGLGLAALAASLGLEWWLHRHAARAPVASPALHWARPPLGPPSAGPALR